MRLSDIFVVVWAAYAVRWRLLEGVTIGSDGDGNSSAWDWDRKFKESKEKHADRRIFANAYPRPCEERMKRALYIVVH